jgi:hypothetical protein
VADDTTAAGRAGCAPRRAASGCGARNRLKTLAHVEFTRDGRYALASLWEMDGALIVHDAQTLKEVKRIPMRKPVGKYNVFNKVTRSEGTSH